MHFLPKSVTIISSNCYHLPLALVHSLSQSLTQYNMPILWAQLQCHNWPWRHSHTQWLAHPTSRSLVPPQLELGPEDKKHSPKWPQQLLLAAVWLWLKMVGANSSSCQCTQLYVRTLATSQVGWEADIEYFPVKMFLKWNLKGEGS